jgi:hypothetical protein
VLPCASHSQRGQVEMSSGADAVLDTNGFLGMFSNRDLTRDYEKPSFDVESHAHAERDEATP